MADKKQIPLRLSETLYSELAAWAEDDFRSVNGQIEYLLTECVKQRKKNGKYVSDDIDKPPDIDIESFSASKNEYFSATKKS
ncbi:MAG: PTS ascorbate transporter subunit IIC [Clostridia bacterium]|nr:PTS ascorbate transporter subunit IIC [Clostridia bacterium]